MVEPASLPGITTSRAWLAPAPELDFAVTLPFTTEQFFRVFAEYNTAVWPLQILLLVIALVGVGFLFRPQHAGGRLVSFVLALLWLWMAIVYHFFFFSRINPAALLFGSAFMVEGALLVWIGVVRRKVVFRAVSGAGPWVGVGLLMFAMIVYPVWGYLLGQRFPAFPTFGLPCPTTIFSIGVLMFAEPASTRVLLIVPVLWTFIGALAAFSLGVTEDLSLLVAGVVGMGAILQKDMGKVRVD
jgi:hypothetical protein